jgi:RNA polymerase-binding transcription factor DksA
VGEFAKMRRELEDELHALVRRRTGIERDAIRERLRLDRGPGEQSSCLSSLHDQLDRIDHEEARIRSALHRIERREFDRCILCGGDIPLPDLRMAPFTATCPTCRGGYSVDYAMAMRLQHAGLRSLLRTVRRAIGGLGHPDLAVDREDAGLGSDPSRDDVAAARVLLGDFERELRRHHAVEERHEELRLATGAAPRLTRSVESLCREHAALADELRALVELSGGADVDREGWRTVADRFERLAEAIQAHEQRENEIVMAALLDDIGTAD